MILKFFFGSVDCYKKMDYNGNLLGKQRLPKILEKPKMKKTVVNKFV